MATSVGTCKSNWLTGREVNLDWIKDDIQAVMRKFYSRVVVDSNGCWIWLGAGASQGRGTISVGGWTYRVSMFSFYVFHGTPSARQCVIRECGVLSCVNPDHLIAGTSKECKDLLYQQVTRPY